MSHIKIQHQTLVIHIFIENYKFITLFSNFKAKDTP